jgi:amino acid adenylation domain-containing protein
MPVAVRIHGGIDTALLGRAIEAVVARHESLRTSFPMENGVPIQRIHDSIDLAFRVEDAAAETLTDTVRAFIMQPFDLENGPLIRARAWRLSATEHVLALPMYHLISDGWSLGVLLRELAACYEAFAHGEQPALAPMPFQYADFAVWQRAWLESPEAERQRAYWKARAWDDSALDAIGHAVHGETTDAGATHTVQIPADVAIRVAQFVAENRVTPFTLLLAVFEAVLWRYTACDAVNIGVPTAGRNASDTHGLIGFFVNTIVLRGEFDGDPTFAAFLKRVQKSTLEAFDHQAYPFDQVVKDVAPDRHAGGSPLFRVMFALQNAPVPQLTFGGLQLEPFEVDPGTAKFELYLEIEADGDGFRASFNYDAARFDAGFIAQFAEHFQRFLNGVLNRPETTLSSIELLDTNAREKLLANGQGPIVEFPRGQTLDALVAEQAARTPDSTAISFEGATLTYAQLDRRANALAHALVKHGVRPGALVGVFVERSPELIVALLGVLKAGAAYVPLDPGYPPTRLAYMLKDAGANVVVTQAGLTDRIPGEFDGDVLCVDQINEESVEPPAVESDPQRLAYLIYTSGSTGKPKGVAIQHEAVVSFMTTMANEPGITETDVLLAVTTVSFDIAALELFLPLLRGAHVEIVSRDIARDGELLAEAIASSGATVLQATPATWQMLVHARWQGDGKLKMLCGGEALTPSLARDLLQRDGELWNVYGPTEVTIWATALRVTREVLASSHGSAVSIGAPIGNTTAYILDERENAVPPGVSGELYLGGVQVGQGYWNRPDLTHERFVADPFSSEPGARMYRTGDRCKWRDDGAIEFLGRLDAQVKVRGFRIELGEIESALETYPGVDRAVVAARDKSGHTTLAAYLTGGGTWTAAALRAHVCETLPEYMAPQAFVHIDAIPLTPSGKVDRKALPEPDETVLSGEYEPPRTETERALAAIFAELLGVHQAGSFDNFFELGGHSLLAVQLVSRIERDLQRRVPVRAVFESPTIEGLALAVDRESKPAQPCAPFLEQTRVRRRNRRSRSAASGSSINSIPNAPPTTCPRCWN